MNQQLTNFYEHLNTSVITTNDFTEGTLFRKREKVVTFHHIESNPFSAFRSHPVFGIYEPVRFRHLQAS